MNLNPDTPWPVQSAKKIAALVAYNVSRRTRTQVVTALVRGRGFHRPKGFQHHHGTTTVYQLGCGCEPCRIANRDAQRKRRQREGC